MLVFRGVVVSWDRALDVIGDLGVALSRENTSERLSSVWDMLPVSVFRSIDHGELGIDTWSWWFQPI